MSLDLASRVSGTRAPDFAICVLFSSAGQLVEVQVNAGAGLTVRGEVGDASDGVTLHLDVRTKHLPDEGLEASKRDNEEFVVGCD